MSALRKLLDDYPINGGPARPRQLLPRSGHRESVRRPGHHPASDVAERAESAGVEHVRDGFANSTNQNDYRWGKLHRIVVLAHLGGPFNIPPPAHRADQSSGRALPGFPRPAAGEPSTRRRTMPAPMV
jgi:penicillin amidase